MSTANVSVTAIHGLQLMYIFMHPGVSNNYYVYPEDYGGTVKVHGNLVK